MRPVNRWGSAVRLARRVSCGGGVAWNGVAPSSGCAGEPRRASSGTLAVAVEVISGQLSAAARPGGSVCSQPPALAPEWHHEPHASHAGDPATRVSTIERTTARNTSLLDSAVVQVAGQQPSAPLPRTALGGAGRAAGQGEISPTRRRRTRTPVSTANAAWPLNLPASPTPAPACTTRWRRDQGSGGRRSRQRSTSAMAARQAPRISSSDPRSWS